MSSSYVRTQFRAFAQITSAATTFQFYDMINVNVDPRDDVWWTAEYISESHEGTFCDRGYIERGFIRLVVFANAGLGDLPAIHALELIVPSMLAHIDPTRRLVLEKASPIQEDSGGSARKQYAVSVNIDYSHSM